MISITTPKQQPIQQRNIRYVSSTLDPIPVTRGDLLNWIITFRSSSTEAIPICESVRVQSVAIVLFSDDSADPNSICFKWSGNRSPHTCFDIISANAIPSKFSMKPPRDSLASMWSTRDDFTDEVLFTIDTTSSTAQTFYLDLKIQYVLFDGNSIVTPLTLSSAASAGDYGVALLTLPNDASGLIPDRLVSYSLA
jgi:hypothetical protein